MLHDSYVLIFNLSFRNPGHSFCNEIMFSLEVLLKMLI